MRTYYYIFAPIDSVGNEMMLVSGHPSDNIERIHIDDDWWTYNQHLIPPAPEEPELPLGIPWLQKLNDAMGGEEFRLAGVVLLATIAELHPPAPDAQEAEATEASDRSTQAKQRCHHGL